MSRTHWPLFHSDFHHIVFESELKSKWQATIHESASERFLDKQLLEDIHHLKDTVASYASALGSLLGISILDKFGIFEHLCLLVNPDESLIPRLKYDDQIDYFAACSELGRDGRQLLWGGYEGRVFA